MIKLVMSHSKGVISAIIIGVIIAVSSSMILDYIYNEQGPDERIVSSDTADINTSRPQLWSHHKILDVSAEECAITGKKILQTLGFTSITKNDKYVYGNIGSNRAAIKCVSLSDKSFVYTAVAGENVKVVEKLRNKIAWKL
ncbi:MAG: hypothetical protein MJK12_00015 [Colwellia sp.]|nr:hypothetical protein [Colwellia sp.]